MGIRNKTVILLSQASHQQLCQLAGERGQTLNEFMRQACAASRPGAPRAHPSTPPAQGIDEGGAPAKRHS